MAETEASNLAEYKAGRMILLGKMVEPDERKGLLFVRRSAGDNQVHIHWMDRRSGAIELDIVATPGVIEFRRIDQCKTGRVYVLKYTRSPQRYFFWMQEPQADGDALFCQRVNDLIASGERNWHESAAAEGDVDTDVEHERHRGFGGSENPQVLADMLAGTQKNWLTANQSLTHWHTNDAVEEKPPLAFSDPHTDTYTEILDLATVLRTYGVEAVENLLSCPLRREKLVALLPKDPEADDTHKDIREHLHSPQFYETLSYFSFGLHSGVLRSILEPLLQHDHLSALDAAQVGDIERFLRELHQNERDYSGPTD